MGEVFAGRESLKHTHINGARLAHALVAACSRDLPAVQLFVDSNTSMFGRPYHRHAGLPEVVDLRLAGALRRRDARGAVGDAHEYALEWYAATVQSPDPKCGHGWSLPAAQRATEAGDSAAGFDPGNLAAGYVVRGDRAPVAIPPSPVASPVRHDAVPLSGGELKLTPERPDVSIAIPPDGADLVDFEYDVAHAGVRTRVEGAVERVLAFSGAAGEFEVPSWGLDLRIPRNRDVSSPVVIQFRLVEAELASAAVVRGLRAVRTGPRTSNYDSTSKAVTVGLACGERRAAHPALHLGRPSTPQRGPP